MSDLVGNPKTGFLALRDLLLQVLCYSGAWFLALDFCSVLGLLAILSYHIHSNSRSCFNKEHQCIFVRKSDASVAIGTTRAL